ncbi:thioredoxin family protein [Chitinophagaceae bacterium MMS25-I14]
MNTLFESATPYFSYESFLALDEQLVKEGKTTGLNQSEKYVFYTKLNLQRMHRWDKTFQLREDIREQLRMLKPQVWWVITETWCGDSAQNLPGIAQMAAASEGRVELRIIMRDENLNIMDEYLTNGGRSIPKLVAISEDGEELFNWGPRPATAQTMMMTWKNDPQGKAFDDFERELHTWYTQNKGAELQDEFMALLRR